MTDEQLDNMTAGELCDLIDRAVRELRERNQEAREAGAHELQPAGLPPFYTTVPPSEQRKAKRKDRRCDLNCGWPECWNTECRLHGKDAVRWHAIRKRIADERMPREEGERLRAEERALYEKLSQE